MISLLCLLLGFDLSTDQKITEFLGPVRLISYDVSTTWQGKDQKMTLLALSHGYSAYDLAQLDGQIPDTESISGVLTWNSDQDIEETLAVVGTRSGELLKLRPLDILNLVRDRAVTSDDLRLWMESKSGASPTDRELTFKISKTLPSQASVTRAGGFSRMDQDVLLSSFDQIELAHKENSLVLGILTIAWPYQSRKETSKAVQLWRLGRALESEAQSTLEADLLKMNPAEWEALALQYLGKAMEVESFIQEAKRLTRTPQLTEALDLIPDTFKEGSLEDAFGCGAAQVVFFPMVGRRIGSEVYFITGEWHPGDSRIFKARTLTLRKNDQIWTGETSSEQYQPGVEKMTTSGRFKLTQVP